MISKNFTLSCYALENPFQAYYSHSAEMIELIDINRDIYQFRLPDYQNNEKMQASCAIKQYFRFYSISLILYQSNTLMIQKYGGEAQQVQNVEKFTINPGQNLITLLLLQSLQDKQSMMKIRVVDLIFNKNETISVSEVKSVVLLNGNELQNYSFQKYVSEVSFQNEQIQQIFGHFCLLKHKEGQYSIAQLILDQYGKISDNLVKYDLQTYELPHIVKVIGHYKNTLMIVSSNQKQSQNVCLINAEQKQVIVLKKIQLEGSKIQYFLYEKYIVIFYQQFLWLFASIKGTLMAKINICHILEQFQEGSILVLKQLDKEYQKYSFLIDQSQNSLKQIYLIDKQKIQVYKLNISCLIQQYIVGPIFSIVSTLSDQKDQIHLNVMKTLNFRTKKLNTLQQYLNEGIKTLSFGHTIRFLHNQENIFVLNDGLYLFYKALESNIEAISNQRTITMNLQKEIIELSTKLISESKYQGHISKGLTIANKLFSLLRTNLKILKNSQNLQVYVKMLQSKRAIRLLKQDKNKQLFELCYQLAILVKGYDYLQQIEKKQR